MWVNENHLNSPATQEKGFFCTPPAKLKSWTPKPLMSERKPTSSTDPFHVINKVPVGDTPYVKAKRVQLIDKDPGKAVSLFWSAINSGDRVDSALKDMAVVMKQLNRSDEAIEAIKSFRHLCSPASQESLDNVLVELYKRSGRLEEQIQVLQHKLKLVEEGNAFGGKRVKLARSQGKKVHITVEQEYARLLGNLAWAYLQQNDYKTAEEYYRKALSIEIDRNKQCNLAVCLMYMNRTAEAKFLLQVIRDSAPEGQMDESYAKSFDRAFHMLAEMEEGLPPGLHSSCQQQKENCLEQPIRNQVLPKSPFTQPRRDRIYYHNNPTSHSHRRLQFDKPFGGINIQKESCAIQEVHNRTIPQIDKQKNAVTTDYSTQNEDEQEHDLLVYKSKKSWADMVEEEEQELINELLTGENVDLNVIGSSQNSETPAENLSCKLQCCGRIDQPPVRRSLVFTQQQKEDPANANKRVSSRLKVFQDITPP